MWSLDPTKSGRLVHDLSLMQFTRLHIWTINIVYVHKYINTKCRYLINMYHCIMIIFACLFMSLYLRVLCCHSYVYLRIPDIPISPEGEIPVESMETWRLHLANANLKMQPWRKMQLKRSSSHVDRPKTRWSPRISTLSWHPVATFLLHSIPPLQGQEPKHFQPRHCKCIDVFISEEWKGVVLLD